MITVLMALFIVLFAISQVDQEKYIALRDSLSAGFQDTATSHSILDGSTGNLDGTSAQSDEHAVGRNGGHGQRRHRAGRAGVRPDLRPARPAAATGVDPAVLAAAQAEAAHLEQLQAQIEAALARQRARQRRAVPHRRRAA